MPRPSVPNTMSVVTIDCVTAQAMAVAMNGPVQGVASTVVITPLRNAPSGPSFAAASWTAPLPKKPGIGISHTPSRLSAMANTMAASVTLNAGAAELPAPGEADRRGQKAEQQEHRRRCRPSTRG